MPIRILHIVTNMDRGGLETLLMNCYRHVDRSLVQFDFLVHRYPRAAYDDEIEELGGKIYRFPRLNPFDPWYKKALRDFFRSHPEYRIVHCHLDCMSGIPLSAAKDCGVPVRIAHSHNSNQDRNWKYILKRYYMKKIPDTATHFFACSDDAGKFMFPGQTVTTIKNGIETHKFAFDPVLRQTVREELGLKDELVLGHVGRFMPQKNHDFLIDIFAEVHGKVPNAKLILAGNGPLEAQIKEKVSRLGLSDCVEFLGVRSDVNRILQAVDVFVLPSLYEGLGIAAVEAQATGAVCILSDEVPEACRMTNLVSFLSLQQPAAVWAQKILDVSASERTTRISEIAAAGYDIQNTAEWLQSFYTDVW